MNFMKILLIYMAATLSLAVQNTSAPVETPVPTPAPTAEVQTRTGETVPAGIVEAVTPTPVPTATPAPVPQITPNKKYHNLAKGDKGADVRALQERLIELGYLPAGAADGAYGNQTVRAVRNFQAYNGLTRDGIAGRATQTYLFENPDVNPYPTPTPSPTVTSHSPSGISMPAVSQSFLMYLSRPVRFSKHHAGTCVNVAFNVPSPLTFQQMSWTE
jgi:peptidoglycan hydrolase-like protein with peptidoglycan-binding domain